MQLAWLAYNATAACLLALYVRTPSAGKHLGEAA